MQNKEHIDVIGGGLAGCEAAWQLLKRGYPVTMHEQRPLKMTPAHTTGFLAELVCSNSFRSNALSSAAGLLKAEMRLLDSLIMKAAEKCRVPAGQALAVDRTCFSAYIKENLHSFAHFDFVTEEVEEIPEGPAILATGPLTSEAMSNALAKLVNSKYLYFYDAIAPIVEADTVDPEKSWWANRYGKGDADYLNCPLNKQEYEDFLKALRSAEVYPTHDFEDDRHFEGCLPIEEMAARGDDVLRFGPMKPVGLENPDTGELPWAVVQLRKDDLASQHLNIVGFQTKMKKDEQKRVICMIPALKNAKFARYGQMHRNSFVNAPNVLHPGYQLKVRENLFVAGQLSGVEGYVESAASGLASGIYMSKLLKNSEPVLFPKDTALGALGHYIAHADPDMFQPMNITFGLIQTDMKFKGSRKKRREAMAEHALKSMQSWISDNRI